MAHVLVSRLSVPLDSLKRSAKIPKPPEELPAFPITHRIFGRILMKPQPFRKFLHVFHLHTVIFYVIERDKQESVGTFGIVHCVLAQVIEESAHTLSGTLKHLHIVGIFQNTARNRRDYRLGVVFGCLVPR